jgi:hypothetical protein
MWTRLRPGLCCILIVKMPRRCAARPSIHIEPKSPQAKSAFSHALCFEALPDATAKSHA